MLFFCNLYLHNTVWKLYHSKCDGKSNMKCYFKLGLSYILFQMLRFQDEGWAHDLVVRWRRLFVNKEKVRISRVSEWRMNSQLSYKWRMSLNERSSHILNVSAVCVFHTLVGRWCEKFYLCQSPQTEIQMLVSIHQGKIGLCHWRKSIFIIVILIWDYIIATKFKMT